MSECLFLKIPQSWLPNILVFASQINENWYPEKKNTYVISTVDITVNISSTQVPLTCFLTKPIISPAVYEISDHSSSSATYTFVSLFHGSHSSG